jgi:NADH:ubiquinone oxidoreductase subunit K
MGQIYALLILTVAAAESALGLAILMFIIACVAVFLLI